MASPRLHRLCRLAEGEAAVCCVNIGTVQRKKASKRLRPLPPAFFSELRDE
jgi:hypothetical protein